MMEQEGVIKYRLDFDRIPCEPNSSALAELNRVRTLLIEKGMMGQDHNRYDGYGFGNVSYRDDNPDHFWISGSQTGHISSLSASDMALVVACDARHNHLQAMGETKPSSESMTHGVLYGLNSTVNAVIHVHCPEIWAKARALRLAATPVAIPYGTPEMAAAVEMLANQLLSQDGLPIAFVMLGHEDGVVAAGASLNECVELLVTLQAGS